MKIATFLISILVFSTSFSVHTSSSKVTISKEEQELYKLIMEYRIANNLPIISLSSCLTQVAQIHSRDVVDNKPNEKTGCNMHSWSDQGTWSPCCYTDNHANAKCMWNKPSELTSYKSDGFEIVHWIISSDGNAHATALGALNGWKTSPGHNDVILNQKIWQRKTWKAIGIGIYKGFVSVWFGDEIDKEGEPGRE